MTNEELLAWLEARGHAVAEASALPGDVSPRRYSRVRLESGGSAIAAVYPPELEDAYRRFLRSTELLEGAGVRVPAVLERDAACRFMLVEDVGPRALHQVWAAGGQSPEEACWEERLPVYRQALAQLGRIQALPASEVADLNPVLGEAVLARELRQTWEVYLEPRGLLADPGLAREVEGLFAEICRRVGEAPPVPCHRDFMVRNLVPVEGEEGSLAVLDHQDLRPGPPFYDLASLLNDTVFPPPEVEARLLEGLLPDVAAMEAYRRTAVQRALKAVGTFAAFAARGAPGHLPLIPPTLARALAQLPEGGELAPRLFKAWESDDMSYGASRP